MSTTQPFLSELAVAAPRLAARGLHPAPDMQVRTAMREQGWTMLRAWREALGCSRAAMATRLGLAAPTYVLLEDGTIPLCRWTAPGLEMILLTHGRQPAAAPRARGTVRARLPLHRRAAVSHPESQ